MCSLTVSFYYSLGCTKVYGIEGMDCVRESLNQIPCCSDIKPVIKGREHEIE